MRFSTLPKTILLDFILIPVLNIPLTRILTLFWGFKNFKSLFFNKFFYFSLSILLVTLLRFVSGPIDMQLFLFIFQPFIFGILYYGVGSKLSAKIFSKFLYLGVSVALFLNISLLILNSYGITPLNIAEFLNFSALRGDQNLINITRISLPFVNPVRLSLFAGFCFFYFRIYKGKNWKLYAVFSFILLVWSGSRTGFVSILCAELFFRKLSIKTTLIYFVYFLVIYYLVNNLQLRFFDFSEETTFRHFLLRSQTIEVIRNFSIIEFFTGVGLGNSPLYIDGTYSFSVFLTLMLECGIFISLFWLSLFNKLFKSKLIFYLFLVTLFYELKSEPFLWISLGYLNRINL